MKNLLLLAIAILGFSAVSFGQGVQVSTASATASGTIKAAISINHSGTDMNFGNIIPGAIAGTVVLVPAGTRSLGVAGDLVLAGGTVSAAVFTVTGTPSSTYSIGLPADGYKIFNGTNFMILNGFNSTPTVTDKGLLDGTTGKQELRVGATLSVDVLAANPAGLYIGSAPFEVTVNYN